MFRITLINCDPDTALASSDLGSRSVGELQAPGVLSLLEKFRDIDPIQNAVVDPEIVLEGRRGKHIVRTSQGRLHLYNSRNLLEPALVLSPKEIVAELDGSAAAARARATVAQPVKVVAEPLYVPEALPFVSALGLLQRAVLVAVALCLAGYLGYSQLLSEAGEPAVKFEPLADAKQEEALREKLVGVYMVGAQPGHHGISLGEDGTMKLFQLNVQSAPSLIQDTFRVGRIGAETGVFGSEPGRVVRVTAGGALTYGGETYKRLP